MSTMKKYSTGIATAIFVLMMVVIGVVNFAMPTEFTFAGTFWALVPPIVAIVLALITKEVYSSLFVGVILGAFMVAKCSFDGTVNTLTNDGVVAAVSGTAGIFVFLVILGIIVALVNKAGASRAFGEWAQKHVKTKVGALLATFLLGVLIFIDDYFNCLTVGAVMAPVTDSKKISRVKLAYIIDATAAPVCMIAPISSWAAAVSGCVESETYSGIELFIRAIPFNFYSLFTLAFVILISVMAFDYGKMTGFEIKAEEGELGILPEAAQTQSDVNTKGRVFDLLIPVIILVVMCVVGLLYNGFQALGEEGGTFIDAFSSTDATVGLPWGSFIALVAIVIYLIIRRVVTFEEAMECVPKGFVAMVPAILILTLATSLKNVVDLLDAKTFIDAVMSSAQHLTWLLPALIFVVACLLSFATGTSWGTFGILIPLVSAVFPETSNLFFVGISACLAGAVCGDHCSPISDTTIMSSAGANCNHLDHVSTQLPYAFTVAAVSFVAYLIAGVCELVGAPVWISIPTGFAILVITMFVIKSMTKKKVVG